MSAINESASRNTKKRLGAEKLAKGLIWAAAGCTILTLILILSFILIQGFWKSADREYQVTSIAEDSFDGYKVVVNAKLRLKELPWDSLRDLYSGEYIDWGKLAEQEAELLVILPESGSPAEAAEAQALGLTPDLLTPFSSPASSDAEALSQVAGDPGAIALVAPDAPLPKGVKSIRLRRTAIAVNPSVTELQGNTVLRSLSRAQTEKLFRGEIRNWKEVGGLDLPVTIVLPPESSSLHRSFRKSGITAPSDSLTNVVASSTEAEYTALLQTTPGAAGFYLEGNLEKDGLSSLRFVRRESGPNLSLSYLFESPKMSGRVGGISTIILNTLVMILLTLLVATPIGVFAAIYLIEYAKQGPLVSLLRLGTETLAGIPSIIFGLFGMLFFVNILGWGIGLISGVLTLTLMILPTIVRTSEEALKTVSPSLREGSLALGASKLQTTLKVVVPAASPGILTGVILAIGRAVGETAALIFTLGSSYDLVSSLHSSTRVLAVHVYLIIAEGISMDKAFATATVLVFIILAVNLVTTRLIGRISSMGGK